MRIYFFEAKRFFEAKQVGTIYHVCSLENLIFIAKHNALIPGSRSVNHWSGHKGISFTRDKTYAIPPSGEHVDIYFQFVIDGDKLSERHKIAPSKDKMFSLYSEREEFAEGQIDDLDEYTKEVVVNVVNFTSDFLTQKNIKNLEVASKYLKSLGCKITFRHNRGYTSYDNFDEYESYLNTRLRGVSSFDEFIDVCRRQYLIRENVIAIFQSQEAKEAENIQGIFKNNDVHTAAVRSVVSKIKQTFSKTKSKVYVLEMEYATLKKHNQDNDMSYSVNDLSTTDAKISDFNKLLNALNEDDIVCWIESGIDDEETREAGMGVAVCICNAKYAEQQSIRNIKNNAIAYMLYA